jgi:ABC-type Fe3+-hydroxamate transport system substrate-binding protein
MAQTEEQIASLEEAGIRVFAVDADEIADVYTSIRLIGALMGVRRCGKGCEGMKPPLPTCKASKSGDGETVYFEVSP